MLVWISKELRLFFNPSKKQKRWVKSILIGLTTGLLSFLIVKFAIYIPIPGTVTHTDPREIFTVLGSALGGFPAAVICGVLSGIGTSENTRYASVFAHLLSAFYVAFLYNTFLYKLKTLPLIIWWSVMVLVNFYLVLAPAFILGLYIFNSPPENPISLYTSIIEGANMEIIYTVFITTAVINALPKNLKKPVFVK